MKDKLDVADFDKKWAIDHRLNSDEKCEDLTKTVEILQKSLTSKLVVDHNYQRKPSREEEKK